MNRPKPRAQLKGHHTLRWDTKNHATLRHLLDIISLITFKFRASNQQILLEHSEQEVQLKSMLVVKPIVPHVLLT